MVCSLGKASQTARCQGENTKTCIVQANLVPIFLLKGYYLALDY